MQISSMGTVGYSPAVNNGGVQQDPLIQSIQKQIENVQKQLRSLGEHKGLSSEEKTERRKLLLQQIQDLNQQIAQRKIEMQKERLAAARATEKQQPAPTHAATGDANVDGAASMQDIVRADTAVKQAGILHSVTTGLKGQARVLENEIRTDKGRGGSTDKKEGQLAALQTRIDAATERTADRVSDLHTAFPHGEDSRETEDDAKADTPYTSVPKQETTFSFLA